MTGQDPATASCADVERAIHRRLLSLPSGTDPVTAVMSIVQPVIEAKDGATVRERRRVAAIYGWNRSRRYASSLPPEAELDAYAEISRLQEMVSTLLERMTGAHRKLEDDLRREFTP